MPGKADATKPKSKKKSAKTPSAQQRKDPRFMKHIEAAIAAEYASAAKPAAAKTATAAQAPVTTKGERKTAMASKKKASTEVLQLREELTGLLPELDAEGLAFLIEQARVHLYNMKVVELEAAAQAAESSSRRASQTRRGGAGSTQAATSPDTSLRFEATAGSSVYHLVYQNKWKMFGGDEIMAMVRICSGGEPEAAVAPRLYRWIKNERSDVFQEIPMSGPADPLVAALVRVLRTTFTIKQ